MNKNNSIFAVIFVAGGLVWSGCSEPAKPAASDTGAATAATAVQAATTVPTTPPPAAPSAAAMAPSDIKAENAEQVAAALEKEIEADSADEDKE
jgi:PBP1b-binding outer membrane lipoprotein LpoB